MCSDVDRTPPIMNVPKDFTITTTYNDSCPDGTFDPILTGGYADAVDEGSGCNVSIDFDDEWRICECTNRAFIGTSSQCWVVVLLHSVLHLHRLTRSIHCYKILPFFSSSLF